MQCQGGASGTMSDGDEAYRFLISFGVNALGIKSLIKLANNLRSPRTDGASVTSIALYAISLCALLFSV